ncbi:MAG: ribonuclease PH [Gammaproteobacteria bacterium]|nr:ribonuclease PH [Gammaproteobacteria bacterium]
MRPSQRQPNEMRQIRITRDFTIHAEGSALVEFGETKVICTASVAQGVPRFLRDSNKGWVTAEYGMLPRATHERTQREATRGTQGGRTFEIQRLIGRSLRAMINTDAIRDYTITIDCDVIQADGGTRTAAITGACVALIDAVRFMQQKRMITKDPIRGLVSAVSVGIFNNVPVLDLDYKEDSKAEVDMNIVMTDRGEFIEVQGTGEQRAFSQQELNQLLELGNHGIQQLFKLQKEALGWVTEAA